MSGGHFNYNQHRIQDIIERIERKLLRQGDVKAPSDLYCDYKYYGKHPEEKYHTRYSPEVQQIMRDAIVALEKAFVYAQRIDWYLSGDDGEECLVRRLQEDLSKLKIYGK